MSEPAKAAKKSRGGSDTYAKRDWTSVSVRLPRADLAQISAGADEAGLTMVGFLRMTALLARQRGWKPTKGDWQLLRAAGIEHLEAMSRSKPKHAKITPDVARSIREEYAKGDVTQRTLAKRHGLSQSQVLRIVRGAQWKGTDNKGES